MAAARTVWQAEATGLDPARLIFIDESGFDTRLVRTHARAPRSQRAHGTAPGLRWLRHRLLRRRIAERRWHWERLTLIGALAHHGVCAAMTVAAATDTAVFHAFVTQVLIPALLRERPDAIVVMDNLPAHKAACVRAALDQAGISYRYLPAYSPDMNPIEQAWSKLKTYLRAIAPWRSACEAAGGGATGGATRSREALEHAIPDALITITPSNAQGWFRHAGYALN